MNKLLLVLGLPLLVTACATSNTLYSWGQYEETLFVHYHDPALKEAALKNYLQFAESGGSPERPVAPGLYAEAGTFMLEQGDLESAVKYYRMEYNAWPESRPMLGTLIANLEEQIDE